MTWLQSVALVLAAVAALLTAHLLRLTMPTTGTTAADADAGELRTDLDAANPADAAAPADRRARSGATPWVLVAGGLAALAIDERFALHERLRDGVLAPRDVTVPFLPWVGARRLPAARRRAGRARRAADGVACHRRRRGCPPRAAHRRRPCGGRRRHGLDRPD